MSSHSRLWTGLLAIAGCTTGTASAFAGFPIPAPLAGAAGPIGLAAAGVAYLGYRAFRRFRDR